MAARKQTARGQTGEIPTEDKPKSRTPVSKPQASATTSRAASVKSAALNVGGGEKSANTTPIKKNHRHYTTDEIVEALLQKGGIIADAALIVGCDRDTIYRRKDEPAIAEAIQRGRYYATDEAEAALREQVKARDTTAIIFTLKTLGKTRGYVERQELTGASGGAIEQRVIVRYEGDDTHD